jgi:hypothetical protein
MSFPTKVEIGAMNRRVTLRTVVSLVTADTEIWAQISAFPEFTYWTSGALGFLIRTPTVLIGEDEWPNWYFVYGGKNYYWYQYWLDDTTSGQFVFVEAHAASFSTGNPTLGDLGTYDSDQAAQADGLDIGDAYWAGSGHDRAAYGSLTKRLI